MGLKGPPEKPTIVSIISSEIDTQPPKRLWTDFWVLDLGACRCWCSWLTWIFLGRMPLDFLFEGNCELKASSSSSWWFSGCGGLLVVCSSSFKLSSFCHLISGPKSISFILFILFIFFILFIVITCYHCHIRLQGLFQEHPVVGLAVEQSLHRLLNDVGMATVPYSDDARWLLAAAVSDFNGSEVNSEGNSSDAGRRLQTEKEIKRKRRRWRRWWRWR